MLFVDDGISGTTFDRPDFQRMEAIIEEDVWERVQELRKNKRRLTATGRTSLFSGLVYCPDCGVFFTVIRMFSPPSEEERAAQMAEYAQTVGA